MDLDTETFVVADPISAVEGRTYTHEGEHSFRLHNVIQGDTLAMGPDLVAFDWQTKGSARTRPGANGNNTSSLKPRNQDALSGAMGVRRLTPLETERLQGFPDDWTEFTADGRAIPDSHRYRLMGNAVATVCAQWLGHRLVLVDNLISEEDRADVR